MSETVFAKTRRKGMAVLYGHPVPAPRATRGVPVAKEMLAEAGLDPRRLLLPSTASGSRTPTTCRADEEATGLSS